MLGRVEHLRERAREAYIWRLADGSTLFEGGGFSGCFEGAGFEGDSSGFGFCFGVRSASVKGEGDGAGEGCECEDEEDLHFYGWWL